jgi:hypothetical protein
MSIPGPKRSPLEWWTWKFEYLFKNLTVTNEDAREYLKRVSAPTKAG